MEIAKKERWKTIPMSNPKRLEIEIEMTETEYDNLKMGFIPESMDNRWFVYVDNDTVFMHRSWTGYEIYRAKIIPDLKKYCIREFFVERAGDRYNQENDELDISSFRSHIKYLTERENLNK